jgi:hypothetical protein
VNIIVEATMANGQTLGSLRAVYYSASDRTALWQRRAAGDHLLAWHEGSPEQYRLEGRNRFGMPADQGVISYMEKGCACGHAYKRYTPPDPWAAAEGLNATREHAR